MMLKMMATIVPGLIQVPSACARSVASHSREVWLDWVSPKVSVEYAP